MKGEYGKVEFYECLEKVHSMAGGVQFTPRVELGEVTVAPRVNRRKLLVWILVIVVMNVGSFILGTRQ